jgi:hypothetical protein
MKIKNKLTVISNFSSKIDVKTEQKVQVTFEENLQKLNTVIV